MVTERIIEACNQLINALSDVTSTIHNLALLLSWVLKNSTKQLHVITPHTVTGDVVNVYNELNGDLNEK